MNVLIRPYTAATSDILRITVLAWEPVFTAWEKILGPRLYPLAIYPDWRKSQQEVVEKICQR